MDHNVKVKNEVTVEVAVNEMEGTESDEASLLTNMKNGKDPCTITLNWQFLVGIFSILLSLGLMISQNTGGVPVFLIRYLFLAHGILHHNIPEQKCNISVAVHGHQFNQVPLRKIALYTGNISAGVAGIILTVSINRGYYVWELFCFILSIILSIMIIMTTIKAIFDIHYTTQSKVELERLMDLIENSIQASWKHCHVFIDALGRVLPMVNNDTKQISFSNKEVHFICIALGMVLSMAMFSAQIWSIDWDDNSYEDPSLFFARDYLDGLFGTFYRSERVKFIAISSVLTFLVSITLVCLLTRTTHFRLLLFSFLALGIGTFFILFSSYTVLYIILMGIGLPGYLEVKYVYLAIFSCVPILGSLFLAISYSSITQMCGHKTAIKSTSQKTWLTCTGTLLAILVIISAATTMFSTNWATMMAVQQKWNSTDQLDFQVQAKAIAFSLSHLSHIESLLFFSFFILLTGKKIIKGSLFLPGLLLFGSSILTVTFGILTTTFGKSGISFTTLKIFDFHNKVFILNCFSIGTAFITGVVCLFVGNGFLINLLAFIYKFILILTVFLINILYTLYGCVIKAAGNINHMTMKKKQEPKFGTEQEAI